MIPKSVIKMVRDCDHPSVGILEKGAIIDAMQIADTYGYGNIICWLQTAWATNLRDQGIPERAAAEATQMSPHPLPK